MRRAWGVFVAACLGASTAWAAPQRTPRPPLPLDTFEFGLYELDRPGRIALLRSLGYAGIVLPWPDPAKIGSYLALPAVREGRFKVDAVLVAVKDRFPNDHFGPVLDAMAGHVPQLWMSIEGVEGVALAEGIRAIARAASARHVTLVLYPHVDSSLPSAERTAELIRSARLDGVRLAINLVQEHKGGNRDRLPEVVRRTVALAGAVTLNGSETEDGLPNVDFSRTILPLDRGDFDVRKNLIEPLVLHGYRGIITLHTWNVKDAPADHLARSMDKWREMNRPVRRPR